MAPIYRSSWRTMRTKNHGSRNESGESDGESAGKGTGAETTVKKHGAPISQFTSDHPPSSSTNGDGDRPASDIPGVVHSIVKCPVCHGYMNLRMSPECYHCGYRDESANGPSE